MFKFLKFLGFSHALPIPIEASPIKKDIELGLYNRVFESIRGGYTPSNRERQDIEEVVQAQIKERQSDILGQCGDYLSPRSFLMLLQWHSQLSAMVPGDRPIIESLTRVIKSNMDEILPAALNLCESQSVKMKFEIEYSILHRKEAKEKALDLSLYTLTSDKILALILPQNQEVFYRYILTMISKFDAIYNEKYYADKHFEPMTSIYKDLKKVKADFRKKMDVAAPSDTLTIKSPVEFHPILMDISSMIKDVMKCDHLGDEKKLLIKDKVTATLPDLMGDYMSFSTSARRTLKNVDGDTPYDIVMKNLKDLSVEVRNLLDMSEEQKFKNLKIHTKNLQIGRS